MSKLMEWFASDNGLAFRHDNADKFLLDCMIAAEFNRVDAVGVVFDMKIEAEDIMNDDTGPYDCEACLGSGGLASSPCESCNGTGERRDI